VSVFVYALASQCRQISFTPYSFYLAINIAISPSGIVTLDGDIISALTPWTARVPGYSCIKSGIISKWFDGCQYSLRLHEYRPRPRVARLYSPSAGSHKRVQPMHERQVSVCHLRIIFCVKDGYWLVDCKEVQWHGSCPLTDFDQIQRDVILSEVDRKKNNSYTHKRTQCLECDRLCALVVWVPGYWTEVYCVCCEVRTEFMYVM
jgi:hypothetical protein